MSTPQSLLLGLGLSLALLGCKGGDPVQELCETIVSCECSMALPVDACVTEFNANIDETRMQAEALGLSFNQGCADKTVDQLAAFGCAGFDDASDLDETCFACSPVHGDKPLGAVCTRMQGYSDCAYNLTCRDGACVDPCKTLKSGEACFADVGEEFESLGTCDAGLHCDFESLTCKPSAGVGGACADFDECARDLYCGVDMKCAPIPKEGEPCDFLCEFGYTCEAGTCAPGPAEGEPCATSGFGCGPDLECGDDDVCVRSEPFICIFSGADEIEDGTENP